MSLIIRDGRFDVVVAAGPRVSPSNSAGARALSAFCAEMGLTVGMLGDETLVARGVIASPGTGGLVLAEDVQGRLHRIQARAVVRISARSEMPDPFAGWRSPGLIPLSTAMRIRHAGEIPWDVAASGIAILGTGNRALRFGSSLLDSGLKEVVCIETWAQWGAKRFAGWEVERRRFDALGGRVIEARPVSLMPKSPLIWELRVQDAQGVRVLEVGRVVSAGPFREFPGVREHPPGSFLFEFEQTAGETRADDVEGWTLEEERGRWLASRIVKQLSADLSARREQVDRIYRRARSRLKRVQRHREEPFTPTYQGKWLAAPDTRKIRAFPGVPKQAHLARPVASIECIEDIQCDLCEKACPESAIKISRQKEQFLVETDCTACGLCLNACPSSVPVLLHERDSQSTSAITLSWRGSRAWKVGESAVLVNRRGESLGSGRVTGILSEHTAENGSRTQLVQVDIPTHLVWEARSLRRQKATGAEDAEFISSLAREEGAEKVEITVNGEKRLVRDGISLTVALHDFGQSRPEDMLHCPDGSCGLCMLTVDSVRKSACQVRVRRGMSVRLETPAAAGGIEESALCPCMGVTREQVIERARQGRLRSPEAVLSVTHVGEGRCHGQLCMEPFRRVLVEQGLDPAQWIDWRFPWADWVLKGE